MILRLSCTLNVNFRNLRLISTHHSLFQSKHDYHCVFCNWLSFNWYLECSKVFQGHTGCLSANKAIITFPLIWAYENKFLTCWVYRLLYLYNSIVSWYFINMYYKTSFRISFTYYFITLLNYNFYYLVHTFCLKIYYL